MPKVHATQTNTDNTIDEVEMEDTTSHLPQYHTTATCDTDPNDQHTFDSEPPSLGQCPELQSTVLTEPEFITELQSNKLLEEPPSVKASVLPTDWDSRMHMANGIRAIMEGTKQSLRSTAQGTSIISHSCNHYRQHGGSNYQN